MKGDVYEGLLEKNAQDTKGGAGQYFTPRAAHPGHRRVRCGRTPGETICDPACGTGGFLLAAHDYVADAQPQLDRGPEAAPAATRRCTAELVHGDGAAVRHEPATCTASVRRRRAQPPIKADDSLARRPRRAVRRGADQSAVRQEVQHHRRQRGGRDQERETLTYEREDFWATTKNKQLNFVQHVKTLLKINGRAAVVVPDNVLFEGGAGETVRRKLLHECDVHTLLRLPTGIFYAQGVKANVLFFDRKPAQRDAVDEEALGLRPADEHALHAEDEPAEAGRPRRVRRLLQPGATATSASRPGARRTPTAAGARTTTTN